MVKSEDKRTTKQKYCQEQIKKWQESNVSQAIFCHQAGIKLSTFVYWRSLLLELENKNINKFVPVKIIKEEEQSDRSEKIQIKLLTGYIVYLPTDMELTEIANLIHTLGLPHA